MDHKEKLKNIYQLSFNISDINNIPEQYQQNLDIIANNVCNRHLHNTIKSQKML